MDRAAARHARRMDDAVETTGGLDDGGDRQLEASASSTSPRGIRIVAERPCGRFGSEVDPDHRWRPRREPPGGRLADARGRAGHQNTLTGKSIHRHSMADLLPSEDDVSAAAVPDRRARRHADRRQTGRATRTRAPWCSCTAAGRPVGPGAGPLRRWRSAAGRRVTVDMRGHGESDWSAEGDYRVSSFAADIGEILDLLPPRAGARRRVAGWPHLDAAGRRTGPRHRRGSGAGRHRARHGSVGRRAYPRLHGRQDGRRIQPRSTRSPT